MRRLLLLFGLALAGPAAAQDGWKPFASKEGCFSVLMPHPPVETLQPATATRLWGTRKFEATAAGLFVHVEYADFHRENLPPDVEKLLDEAEAANFGKREVVLRKGKVALAGHPGREYLTRVDEALHFRGRLFLVNSRLYLVFLTGLKEQITSPMADRFFSSFRLTGPVPAPPPLPAPKPLTWKPFSCPEGRFKVLLPGTTESKQSVAALPFGDGSCVIDECGLATGEVFWLVLCFHLPFTATDPQRVLSAAGKSLVERMRATLVSEKGLEGEHPGREILLRGADGIETRSRLLAAGGRLYVLTVNGPPAKLKPRDVKTFFGSFRLAK
jgi:hypothetical protein